jgi:hypothetical protein
MVCNRSFREQLLHRHLKGDSYVRYQQLSSTNDNKQQTEGLFPAVFYRRRHEDPRVSAGDKPPLAVDFLQKQQKQRGCPSRRTARALMRLLETLRRYAHA